MWIPCIPKEDSAPMPLTRIPMLNILFTDYWPSGHWQMSSKDYHITYQSLCRQLLAERNASGYWTGELAISALSTAVAIVALKLGNDPADGKNVEEGYLWL